MVLMLAAVMIDSDDGHTGDADHGGGGDDRDGGAQNLFLLDSTAVSL